MAEGSGTYHSRGHFDHIIGEYPSVAVPLVSFLFFRAFSNSRSGVIECLNEGFVARPGGSVVRVKWESSEAS